GWRILMLILKLVRHERPMLFFGALAALFATSSLVLAAPVFENFLQFGTVPRLPTAVLAMGLMTMAFLSVVTGTVLDTVSRGRRETRMLAYLRYPAVSRSAR
ncbi:MAG: glycosyl transferase, partial [Burkholderia multivorans]|nr:glycosyl transferase [Burkholderia multivorans]